MGNETIELVHRFKETSHPDTNDQSDEGDHASQPSTATDHLDNEPQQPTNDKQALRKLTEYELAIVNAYKYIFPARPMLCKECQTTLPNAESYYCHQHLEHDAPSADGCPCVACTLVFKEAAEVQSPEASKGAAECTLFDDENFLPAKLVWSGSGMEEVKQKAFGDLALEDPQNASDVLFETLEEWYNRVFGQPAEDAKKAKD